MDYQKHRLQHYPAVPPTKEEQWPGLTQRPNGTWYFSARDKGRIARGLKEQFTHTEDTYWECLEAFLKFKGIPIAPANSAESAAARNGTAVKIDALGRHMPSLRAVPQLRQTGADLSLSAMLGQYEKHGAVATSDVPVIRSLARHLKVNVSDVTKPWALRWVGEMKKGMLTPSTIKKKVESLARALDWYLDDCATKEVERLGGSHEAEKIVSSNMQSNSLRTLPRKYYTYKDAEVEPGVAKPKNMQRNRRLYDDEYQRIRAVLAPEFSFVVFKGATTDEDRAALDVLFQLIVNTAMRLREAYTLRMHQLHFLGSRSQIELPPEVTKTDAGRTIPMTPEVQALLKKWVGREGAKRGKNDAVFPMLWDGSSDYFALKRTSERLSGIFARLFDAAECGDVREHDLRHEGTCRWVEMKQQDGRHAYQLAECMKFTGHMTEGMFFRYASIRGSEAAERLYAPNAEQQAA